MSRIMLSTSRYVQGSGAIKELGQHAAQLGNCALAIGGRTALSLCWDKIRSSLAQHEISCREELFRGVSSANEIARLVEIAVAQRAEMIVALGGGASLDAGKAVAHELNVPVIVVPTTAATDGPCSALAVIYDDNGVFQRYLHLRRNPDCVLMDSKIVANSPARFLVAGMGDALAGFWESGTCSRSGIGERFCGGNTPTLTAQSLSELCYNTLIEFGYQARMAVERSVVTPAVEAVVEANTLMSGLSSENGGHAGAHSIHNGLTVLPATKTKLHGEKVAFGVLAQLVLEGHSKKDIKQVQDFCTEVGLPICLADLNLKDPTQSEIRQVAEAAAAEGETIHATWFSVSADMVEAAIWTADSLGMAYKDLNRSEGG
jgi:glycerol dehydrogenase